MKKTFLLSLFILFFGISCSDDKEENKVNCTDVSEVIVLKVVDKEDKPIALDRFRVVIENKDIQLDNDFKDGDPLLSNMQNWGSYYIVNDGMRKNLFNKRIAVNVTGYIKDVKVIDKVVEVSANECHVYSITDKEDLKVVLDLNNTL